VLHKVNINLIIINQQKYYNVIILYVVLYRVVSGINQKIALFPSSMGVVEVD
jgi:hypothetical protein